MLLNAIKREVILLCVLLSISGISALARVDNNWSRRSNVTVVQHHGGQAGYRPTVGVGYQQPTQWNGPYQNQPQQWQQNNNRTQYNQPNYGPGIPTPAQTNSYRPQQPAYGQAGVYNQTHPNNRPGMPTPAQTNSYRPQQPAYGQAGVYNQTRPNNRPGMPTPAQTNYYRPQQPAYGQVGVNNQTRPSWQPAAGPSYPQYPLTHNQSRSAAANNYPQYPSQGQGSLNQTHPSWPQPATVTQAPNYPQYPSYGQGSVNHTLPQPSAPLLPNNPNNKPAAPPSSSNLYPKLPTLNLPQPAPATGNNGIPLAPLQPAPQNPQGPHNWHSGGQAVLSYGPGHYPSPAGQPNKNQPSHQGSSNPYANMFI